MLLEKEYSIDDQEIKQYFSLDSVIEKMLAIYEEVLSLQFSEVPKEQIEQKKQTWHEQVRLFEVTDKKTKELVGHFYLDLHPRDNKYTHAAVFPLQRGGELADGTRQTPVCAMVCNFSKATPTKPSLLKHDEVVTFL